MRFELEVLFPDCYTVLPPRILGSAEMEDIDQQCSLGAGEIRRGPWFWNAAQSIFRSEMLLLSQSHGQPNAGKTGQGRETT